MSTSIGISVAAVRTSAEGPEWSVGQVHSYQDTTGKRDFIYVCAGEAITGAGYGCVFNDPSSVEMVDTGATTPGTKGPGARYGVAMAAIANGGYGWLQIYGKATVRTLASAAKGTQLNSTGTAGCLDDDAGVGSEVISGVVLGTATGGAEANNSDAHLSYPTVLRTL